MQRDIWMNRLRRDRLHMSAYPLILFTCWFIVILTFILSYLQVLQNGSDIAAHLKWATEFSFRDPCSFLARFTYPFWHIAVALCNRVFSMDWSYAAAVSNSLFTLATTIILYKIIYFYLREKLSAATESFILLFLSICTAIYMPWFNPELYLGQGSPTVWHSPTHIASRPFALLGFFLFYYLYKEAKACDDTKWLNHSLLKKAGCISVLFLVSCWAKPSFMQGFMPTAGLFLLIELISSKGKHFKEFVLCGLTFLPSVFLLFFQAFKSFYTSAKGGGIGFSFFELMSQNTNNILLSLVIGVAFPLWVIWMCRGQIFRDKLLWLSIIYYVVSLAEAVFIVEEGARKYAGDFSWARLLAMYVLFVVTTIRFFEMYTEQQGNMWEKRQNGFIIGFSLMALHFFSGVYYWIYLVMTSTRQL